MKSNITKQEKGFAQIILIVGLLVGIVVMSAVSFYLLKAKGEAPVMTTASVGTSPVPTSTSTPASTQVSSDTLTKSDDTKSIETDLNNTSLDSFDSDLNNLSTSAGSL